MNTVTHTTRGTLLGTAYDVKFHDRGFDMPADEVKAGLKRSDGCTLIILQHFRQNPNSQINASELCRIYGTYTVHEYRSRLTEQGDTKNNAGLLHRMPERVQSSIGGKEHLYELSAHGWSLLIGGSRQLDMFAHRKAV